MEIEKDSKPKKSKPTKQHEILELVERAREGDDDAFNALLKHVEPEIEKIQKSNLWVPGYDDWDIYQECSIMLTKAVAQFDEGRCKNFRFYVRLLFRGRIVYLIQKSTRQKNVTLNNSTSLDDKIYEDEDGNDYCLYDMIPDSKELLSERIERKEWVEKLKSKLYQNLTPMEQKIIELYLEHHSYAEISKMLKIKHKSVDNAIQRAKNKIPKILAEEIEEYDKLGGYRLERKRPKTRKAASTKKIKKGNYKVRKLAV